MTIKPLFPLICLALIGWLQWGRGPKPLLPPLKKSIQNLVSSNVPGPRIEISPLVGRKLSTLPRNTKFRTKSELTLLRSTVIDVSDTVDSDKRRELFKASGLDTPEHLESALAIVNEDYPATLTQELVEGHVMALHYLDLSSNLDFEGCTALLQNSIGKFTSTSDRRRGQPYLWDLHDIAQTCTRLDPKGMIELQKSIEHPKVSAQLKLVLKTKGVI